MRAAVAEFSSKSIRTSSYRLTTKNAWAKHVRARWPQNTLAEIQREWDLTEGEARGLLYAQASQPTIDKCLDHPNGGFRLGLLILCLRMQTTLEDYIETVEREAENDRVRAAARERHARSLRHRLAGAEGRPGEAFEAEVVAFDGRDDRP